LQRPIGPVPLPKHRVPVSELRWIASHPPDDEDPT
jgi:hypothetical protein